MTSLDNSKTYAVTGANGYVGSAIVDELQKKVSTPVYKLVRRVESAQDCTHIPFSLGREIDHRKLYNIDVLIHCAYDFSISSWKKIVDINVNGSLNLFRAAKRANVSKIIFISSMSAYPGCKSAYGHSKLMIENQSVAYDVVSIRPGLVYGDVPGGMVGLLNRIVSKLRFVPVFNNGEQKLYLIHQNDLAKLVFCASKSNVGCVPLIAAHRDAIKFKQILYQLAAIRSKRIQLVNVPWRLVHGAVRLLESLRLPLHLRSDSVVSLLYQDPNPKVGSAFEMGISLQGFIDWVERSKARRA